VFFIPAKLGYGDRPMGETIPANSDLVFYVELVKSVDVN
jgi:FKBP-type peptidyl-prolyl cis-trans isomerase